MPKRDQNKDIILLGFADLGREVSQWPLRIPCPVRTCYIATPE
jgi:hypothetical protein